MSNSSVDSEMGDQNLGDQVQVHIVFEYIIQNVPTRTDRQILTQANDFNFHLKLLRKNLDKKGYPDPRALWFVERMFLREFNKKHFPDVRLLRWKSHLKNDPFTLSEYNVLLSPSSD